MTPPATVRPYRPEDLDAVHDICVRTAHNGGDSRSHYTDPDVFPAAFATPYTELEPELAFVLDDGRGRAVGYILGTADTPAFVEAFRTRWLPRIVERFPPPAGPTTTPDAEIVRLLHHPERMVLPELAAYPAHLHIDLLPDRQGRGHGRDLMRTFLHTLHIRGVPSVHLSMLTTNTPARAFYDRLGFHEIEVPDPGPVTYLGRTTADR
ncbi:GNAT family N-acetyltransferase [Streptomyces caniscabiei]|uniref:GNAT family N-acetyltransferase n=1 Tax=Streptomyces caniscabiei TaxID=2746961 RepID=UPI0029B37434|nr:GNAT family N-acetyltransferase [Streptomyces caniscabiei]MDX2600525.1 GNAT family N-acetyltransferase [Streptomyces caniscabiei]MDX2736894.1 GNAT family N-acetyltransferase [Streptomyces caniscabiei]MDX2779149.1 GNAT family N-acetyltransferase [Streptomyces caniscabiei]